MNGHDPNLQDAGDVLRRRAARLAAAAQPASSGPAHPALHFSLGERHCLLELACVREVRRLRGLVPIPLGPAHLSGLAPWRGRMLPVLDLALLLALPAVEPRLLVVLGHPLAVAALAVGDIHEVVTLPPGEAELRARPLEGLRPEIVRGVTPDGRLLLDADRLLALYRAGAP